MTSVCPAGHDSSADDYCDICGLVIPAGAGVPAGAGSADSVGGDLEAAEGGGATDPAPETAECPNCQGANPPNALFCEACGYDFTTGSLPRPVADPGFDSVLDLTASVGQGAPSSPAPAPSAPSSTDAAQWVAEIWIDPDWYADQESTDPLPSAGVPTVIALRATSILIGRSSRSRGIHPDIDLGSDNGISRRHCQLTTDGTRWWVEDLGSSNGTYVGSAVRDLPDDPIPVGQKREIGPAERLYLGAWTRVVIRKAQPGEG